jgi:hypothetical protein
VAEIVVFLDHCSAASHHGRDLSSLLKRTPMCWGHRNSDSELSANDEHFKAEDTPGYQRISWQ